MTRASLRAVCSAIAATCTASQWGLSIQRELPVGFVGQIGYVGSSGVKLFARQYINNIDPVTKTRPLPTFGRMDEKRQDGKSNFHAMQISLHRRVGAGSTGVRSTCGHIPSTTATSERARALNHRSRFAGRAIAATARKTSGIRLPVTGSINSLSDLAAVLELRHSFQSVRRMGVERNLDSAYGADAHGHDLSFRECCSGR